MDLSGCKAGQRNKGRTVSAHLRSSCEEREAVGHLHQPQQSDTTFEADQRRSVSPCMPGPSVIFGGCGVVHPAHPGDVWLEQPGGRVANSSDACSLGLPLRRVFPKESVPACPELPGSDTCSRVRSVTPGPTPPASSTWKLARTSTRTDASKVARHIGELYGVPRATCALA